MTRQKDKCEQDSARQTGECSGQVERLQQEATALQDLLRVTQADMGNCIVERRELDNDKAMDDRH